MASPTKPSAPAPTVTINHLLGSLDLLADTAQAINDVAQAKASAHFAAGENVGKPTTPATPQK